MDLEYRLRDIIQESKKFMRHSRRSFLCPADVNAALRTKNVEPLYGYISQRTVKFKKANDEIFYLQDEIVDFEKILAAPLPKLPQEVTLSAHWLAIDGVQPLVPQNPAPQSKKRKSNPSTPTVAVLSIPQTVNDVLSKEMQQYYETITAASMSDDPNYRKVSLASVASDPGLQPLLPYFVKFCSDTVQQNLTNIKKLFCMVRFLEHLLLNKNFFHEPYLHQMIPILLTTVVCKQLGDLKDDHWTLRTQAAKVLTSTVLSYSDSYPSLLPRVTRTLLVAIVDDEKSISSKYGAVVGLTMLGTNVISTCLKPNIPKYAVFFDQNKTIEAMKLFDVFALALAKVFAESKANQQEILETCGENLAKKIFSLNK